MAAQPSEKQGKSNGAEQPEGMSERVVDGHYYRPLLQAAFKGDWESAEIFFEGDSASKTAKITSRSETVLHIAALSAQDQFLENMVELLSLYPEALEIADCHGRTALHNAVLCGRIRMVKALVRCNPKLTQLADKKGRVPLAMSAVEASLHKEIAWFLAKNTTDDGPSHPFTGPDAIETIIDLTFAGHHDITLYLVRQYPHLMTMKSKKDEENSILFVLALSESHFPSGTRLSLLETMIYKCIPVDLNYKPTDENSDPAFQCLSRSLWDAAKVVVPIIKRVHEVKLKHMTAIELAKQVCIAISHMSTNEITNFFQDGQLLLQATVKGITEIVKLCIQFFPKLILISPEGERLMTRTVQYRQEKTLRLFLKASSTNELSLVPGPTRDESSSLMLMAIEYKAAQYNSSFDVVTDMAGAAFQMQRELQWYKAVESWVVPDVRTGHSEGKTYWNMFVEKHKDLLESGEKWVKDTSNSCMLVATLIATVLFAAAFTVPGGNDENNGVPLLVGHDSFLVFVISDVLGLFSSVTTILLFLAILTSRYEAQDFLESLPKKIITGLCFLFLSFAFMLVASAATLTIVLDKRLKWVLIPITLLTSFPVFLFLILQLPLLFQMVKSTYGPSIFRAEDIWK